LREEKSGAFSASAGAPRPKKPPDWLEKGKNKESPPPQTLFFAGWLGAELGLAGKQKKPGKKTSLLAPICQFDEASKRGEHKNGNPPVADGSGGRWGVVGGRKPGNGHAKEKGGGWRSPRRFKGSKTNNHTGRGASPRGKTRPTLCRETVVRGTPPADVHPRGTEHGPRGGGGGGPIFLSARPQTRLPGPPPATRAEKEKPFLGGEQGGPGPKKKRGPRLPPKTHK